MNSKQYNKIVEHLSLNDVYKTKRFIFLRLGVGGPIYRISRMEEHELQLTAEWIMAHGVQVKRPERRKL